MIKPMFGHRPKPKKFDMPLRYYDPKEDEKRKQRIRIQSSTNRERYRAQNIRVVSYMLVLAIIIWVIATLLHLNQVFDIKKKVFLYTTGISWVSIIDAITCTPVNKIATG